MRYDDDGFTDLEDARRGRLPRSRRSLSSGAIYHLSVRTSSRAKGHSARAAAAYIQRAAEYGREQGAELVYTESGHMPAWAEAEPTSYWDAADLYERANGRLCKKLEFALPLALSAAERRELAVGFAHHLTDGERLPYTLALHAGEGRNPHCHLMISERGNDGVERSPEQWFKRYNAAEPERGGARKSTALRPKAWLEETREAWAEQTNQALERAGHAVRIDHRSLEAQGIERLPSVKLGAAAVAMEARGIESARGDAAERQAQGNAALADLNAELAELEVERQALKRQQEEVEHERAAEGRERGVDPEGPGDDRDVAGLGGQAGGVAGRRGGQRGERLESVDAGRHGAELAGDPERAERVGDAAPAPHGRAGTAGVADRVSGAAGPGVVAGLEPGPLEGAVGGLASEPGRELGGDPVPGGVRAASAGVGAGASAEHDLSESVGRAERPGAGRPGEAAGRDGPGLEQEGGAVAAAAEEARALIRAGVRHALERDREQQAQARREREAQREQERQRERERDRDEGLER